MADPADLVSVLQGYAKPSRPVEGGIPAYGLSLGVGPGGAGQLPNTLTAYAISFLSGVIVGGFVAFRFRRR